MPSVPVSCGNYGTASDDFEGYTAPTNLDGQDGGASLGTCWNCAWSASSENVSAAATIEDVAGDNILQLFPENLAPLEVARCIDIPKPSLLRLLLSGSAASHTGCEKALEFGFTSLGVKQSSFFRQTDTGNGNYFTREGSSTPVGMPLPWTTIDIMYELDMQTGVEKIYTAASIDPAAPPGAIATYAGVPIAAIDGIYMTAASGLSCNGALVVSMSGITVRASAP